MIRELGASVQKRSVARLYWGDDPGSISKGHGYAG